MATYMANKKPHDTVYLMIIRNGEFQILPYKLDELAIPMEYYDRDNVSTIPPQEQEEEDVPPEDDGELSPFEEEEELEEEDK